MNTEPVLLEMPVRGSHLGPRVRLETDAFVLVALINAARQRLWELDGKRMEGAGKGELESILGVFGVANNDVIRMQALLERHGFFASEQIQAIWDWE